MCTDEWHETWWRCTESGDKWESSGMWTLCQQTETIKAQPSPVDNTYITTHLTVFPAIIFIYLTTDPTSSIWRFKQSIKKTNHAATLHSRTFHKLRELRWHFKLLGQVFHLYCSNIWISINLGGNQLLLYFSYIWLYFLAAWLTIGLAACGANEVWCLPTPHCFKGVSRVEVHRLRHALTVPHTPLHLSPAGLMVQRLNAVLLSFVSFRQGEI